MKTITNPTIHEAAQQLLEHNAHLQALLDNIPACHKCGGALKVGAMGDGKITFGCYVGTFKTPFEPDHSHIEYIAPQTTAGRISALFLMQHTAIETTLGWLIEVDGNTRRCRVCTRFAVGKKHAIRHDENCFVPLLAETVATAQEKAYGE